MRIHEIDRSKLLPHDKAFNCAVDSKRRMLYRIEEHKDDCWAKLAICQLGPDWQPMVGTNSLLNLPRPHAHSNLAEDPRWIDERHFSFISATLSPHGHVATQGIGTLTGWTEFPSIRHNHNWAFDGRPVFASEKNWTFWNDKIVYSINPLIVFDHNSEMLAHSQGTINWPHGFMSGSTPLIPYGDKLLGMFHSFKHDAERRRHYVTGWYVIDPVKWRLTGISKEPVLIAQDGPEDLRPHDQQWKPNVVFPCGLIESGDEFAVSYGWQDSRCRIAFFSKAEVAESIVPVTEHFIQKEQLNDPYVTPPAGFDVEIKGKKIHARSWPKLLTQARVLGIPVQDLHDQLAPRVPKEERKVVWAKE